MKYEGQGRTHALDVWPIVGVHATLSLATLSGSSDTERDNLETSM